MTILAPDCYVCRLMAGKMKDSPKDDVFISAFVTGWVEARTRDVVDWYTPDVCEVHRVKFEKVARVVHAHIVRPR